MKLERMRINVTTDELGDGTAYGEKNTQGRLYAVQLVLGTFDAGVDVTITCEHGYLSTTLLIKANFNANSMYYPRILVNADTTGAALTGTSGGDRDMPVLFGLPKVVIAAGGNTKTGGVILHYLVETK